MQSLPITSTCVHNIPAHIKERIIASAMVDKVELWARAEGIVEKFFGGQIDPWQRTVMDGMIDPTVINCSRQAGKSTTAAALSLHKSIYQDEHLTLLISRSQRQSAELLRKVYDMMAVMRSGKPKMVEENVYSCEFFETGSRIISLPDSEETIRGYSAVDLLIEDEASRVADPTYFTTRPMLAISHGRHIVMSTPYGKRGHFFTIIDMIKKGEPSEWKLIEVDAGQIPRLTPGFLAGELAALGQLWYDQEYFCKFLDIIDTIFPYDLIERAFVDAENDDPFGDLIP